MGSQRIRHDWETALNWTESKLLFPIAMYRCEGWTIKKSCVPKNWCFWTVVLVKALKSPLDCKEIKSVNPKGNQSWIFIGWVDTEAETPILWLADGKNWLPDAGKDWGQEEKGMTEDEMVGWHHWLDGHAFEQAMGVVMDREAWCATVYWVAKSQKWLSD